MEEHSKISIETGNRIFERRKQLNITQEQLSEMTGSTPQAISNYERGERELKAGMIVKIASALHVSADFLLTGKMSTFSLPDDLSDNNKQIINDIVEKCIQIAKK